jgi:hypothetical protein
MVIMGGRAAYAFVKHDSATTGATREEVTTIGIPTEDPAVAAVLISVEESAVRVTFDGGRPQPEHGLLLEPGVHFLAFAADLSFAPAREGAPATVSVAWLKERVSTGP